MTTVNESATASSLDLETLNGSLDAQSPRCEVMEIATREVWQSFEPVSREWYDGMVLEPGWLRVGYGAGTMNRAWFRRSPGDDVDGPVRTRDIAGRTFFCCAKPDADGPRGDPKRLMVDKYHSLAFDALRTVPVLVSPDGRTFVQVVEAAPGTPPPRLPDGWEIQSIELRAAWVVDLPAPTETYWFDGFQSFQGPVQLPESARLRKTAQRRG